MLTQTQRRFLHLHQHHFVASWQELFGGAMLRARTDRGHTATLMADEVVALCELGLMQPGAAGGLVLEVTNKGREKGKT